MSVSIRVNGLGKRYAIGALQRPRTYFGEALMNALRHPWQQVRRLTGSLTAEEEFWALRDVTFDVQAGESIGIIGRNGAGKSTLLKILSRITEPTTGRVELYGRVASLLEVGTGFHPELTGRENVFLNGAILGMSRSEIRRRFDEIVAFAEIDQFLDTQVKHYSSGMYMRLAFAVAAHLQPEILIVDEVLAVGDSAFQAKCLGKMGEVSRSGRTVLFVSHNMQAVSTLCHRAVLLENGRVKAVGDARAMVHQYLAETTNQSPSMSWPFADAPGGDLVRVLSVRASHDDRQTSDDFDMSKPITLGVEFCVLKRVRWTVSFWIYNELGINLFATANFHDPEWGCKEYTPGRYSASCVIPAHLLNSGHHSVRLILSQNTNVNLVDLPDVISFRVYDPGDTTADYVGPWVGAIRPLLPWTGAYLGELPPAADTALKPAVT